MTWVLWRQTRLQWLIAAGLIAGMAIPIVITGRARACPPGGPCVVNVTGANLAQILVNLTVAVPVLVGAFWGATLAGREFEAGTAALVWTQSIPRSRWLFAKITTLLVSAAVVSAAVSALVTWWARPGTPNYNNRFEAVHFDTQGVVPVAYALFAAAVGLCAGALWRRVVPAMATTVVGFIAVRLVVELLARPHYMSPIVRISSQSSTDDVPAGALRISTDLMLNGHVVTGPVRLSCGGTATTREAMNACMDGMGYRLRTIYQPADRYWPFQWLEFAIFAGAAALLVLAAVLVLRRRDA